MARRRIGQEVFGFAGGDRGRRAGLDELAASIDWTALERPLAGIYAASKGEKAWPPLALFKALLLGLWHDLSDVRLAEALDDRASFRRFCGFSASEPVPERTAFVRFRAELVGRGLDEALLRAVVRQLEAQRLVVKTGTLIDATVIAAASKDDADAGWSARAGRPAVKGYKAHVATDEEGGIVRRVADAGQPARQPGAGAGAAGATGTGLGGCGLRPGGDAGAYPRERRNAPHPAAHLPPLAAGAERGQGRVERDDPAGAVPHREGLRHRQAQLRPAPRPLPRPRARLAAGPPDRHRLQSQARDGPSAPAVCLNGAQTAHRAPTPPPNPAAGHEPIPYRQTPHPTPKNQARALVSLCRHVFSC